MRVERAAVRLDERGEGGLVDVTDRPRHAQSFAGSPPGPPVAGGGGAPRVPGAYVTKPLHAIGVIDLRFDGWAERDQTGQFLWDLLFYGRGRAEPLTATAQTAPSSMPGRAKARL